MQNLDIKKIATSRDPDKKRKLVHQMKKTNQQKYHKLFTKYNQTGDFGSEQELDE